jgi:hypothetical protein
LDYVKNYLKKLIGRDSIHPQYLTGEIVTFCTAQQARQHFFRRNSKVGVFFTRKYASSPIIRQECWNDHVPNWNNKKGTIFKTPGIPSIPSNGEGTKKGLKANDSF